LSSVRAIVAPKEIVKQMGGLTEHWTVPRAVGIVFRGSQFVPFYVRDYYDVFFPAPPTDEIEGPDTILEPPVQLQLLDPRPQTDLGVTPICKPGELVNVSRSFELRKSSECNFGRC